MTKTEMIEKSVPVEREVMVEQPYTEHVEVRAPLRSPVNVPGACIPATSHTTFGSTCPVGVVAVSP